MFAWLYPMFGALIFLWVLIHMGISLLTAGKAQDLSNEHAESRSSLAGQIVDSFTNNVIVRIFARRRHELSRISESQYDEKTKHVTSLMYVEKVKIWLGVFCFLFVGIFMTWLQIYTYKNGIISIGDLIFTFQGSVNVVMVTWWVGHELPRMFQEIGVCQQAFSIMQAPIQIQDQRNAEQLKITRGEIRFQDVTSSMIKTL
jgi:ATP-binding cassette, subfamily B, bacterial